MSESQMQWRIMQLPAPNGRWVIQERTPETLMPMRGELWGTVSIEFETLDIAASVLHMMQIINEDASIVLSLTP